jgi:arylformamidase
MTVYKQYSQEQLNEQYNNRLHVPEFASYFERWEKLSRDTEREYDVVKNISFGIHPDERLDLFPAKKPLSKTMVFIHGGYWHLLDKTLFHFISGTFLERNVTTVFINYPLAPAASMDQIVLSVRNSMIWLYKNIEHYNGDPSDIYVMGHSAGGHLACMLTVDMDIQFLRAVITLSGLFRLEPLMLSNLNVVLGMDKETAARNSPVLFEPLNLCPILLAVGTDETDEFKSQSMDMYEGWKNKHSSIKIINIESKNHYSIVDAVTDKESSLQSEIFQLMKI